jgi:hypothetical protein
MNQICTDDEDAGLDRLLSDHFDEPSGQLTPAPGYMLSVMDAIYHEAAVPPPIAFPWRRVLPGIAALVCAMVTFFFYTWSHRGTAASQFAGANTNIFAVLAFFDPRGWTSATLALIWVALSLGLSATAVAASFRLVNRRS